MGNPERVTPKAVTANIYVPMDFNGGAHPMTFYDAIRGGEVPMQLAMVGQSTHLRFGPGAMHVLARTNRPIGGVKLAAPLVTRDLVLDKSPVHVRIAATVVDGTGDILSGSIPLHVQVIDPSGVVRHELFRATEQGQFAIDLPLAANDAAGEWQVRVRELLNNSEGKAIFTYRPPVQPRAVAGATPRAVSFGDDRDKVFRFARTFHEATIVKGKGPFNDAAARRLAKILEPWGVKCKEVDAIEAAKARPLSDDEARTWVGLTYAGSGQIKPGDKNPPILAGFNVRGPVILLGNPQDNPLIDFLLKEKFLPYSPDAVSYPGPGRGYFAWQRDAVGPGQESIALIAYDEAGMAEAVGSVYEAAAGIEPLTRWVLADDVRTSAVALEKRPAQYATAWQLVLPDRVVALKAEGKSLLAASHDGTVFTIEPPEKPGPVVKARHKVVPQAELTQLVKDATPALDAKNQELLKKQTRTDRMQSHFAAGANYLAVAYWGGTLRVVDQGGAIRVEERLPQDVSAMVWLGDRLVVGLANGRVQALEAK
jgi:hypothetical protein